MATREGAWAYLQNIRANPAEAPVASHMRRFWKWASEPANVAMYKSVGKGFHAATQAAGIASGASYVEGAIKHSYAPHSLKPWVERLTGVTPGMVGETGIMARYMPVTRRVGSAAGVAIKGLLGPGFIIGFGAMSPHGMAVGMAEETAGLIVGGFALPPAMAVGKLIGRRAGATVGGSIVKNIPFLRHTPGMMFGAMRTGYGIGAVVGSVGGFALGLAAWEAARWSVGFALHTLPTFARQFQSDMAREGFGGDYTDSQGAATMRARSLQVMGKSFANARSALGQEASLMHV